MKGRADQDVFDAVLEEFKQLGSLLAFSVQIRQIDYEAPTFGLIPETTEEKAQV